jgi:hypothetical protein
MYRRVMLFKRMQIYVYILGSHKYFQFFLRKIVKIKIALAV